RLARGTVADDQLALTPPHVRHRVDRLDTGRERLLHRLARNDARGLELERSRLRRLDRPAAVEWVPERVDDAAEQPLADGDARDAPSAPDRLPLADLLPLPEERGPDLVLLEVEGEADDAVLEVEHLHRDRVLEPVHARDAVTDRENGAALGEIGHDVVLLDPLPQDRRDLCVAHLPGVSSHNTSTCLNHSEL